MKKRNLLVGLILCGFWLLSSSEYYLHENRWLDRTEVKDSSGVTKFYLRKDPLTGETQIKTIDGRKAGELKHDRWLDRTEVEDSSGQERWYLRENPWTDQIDIKTMDGQKAGEIRYDPWLDRLEVRETK